LNINSILNYIIMGVKNMEVLNFASPKWVYMLKSVEKWLVGGVILNYSSILKICKSYFYNIFL
jgi:hypothetical protein